MPALVSVDWPGDEPALGAMVFRLGHAGQWIVGDSPPEDSGAGVFRGRIHSVANGQAQIEVLDRGDGDNVLPAAGRD